MSTKNIQIEDPITTQEAAEILGVTPAAVQQRCWKFQETGGKEGLKSLKKGPRHWWIERKDVERYRDNPPATGRPRGS
jgi:hypothetical protein